MSDSTPTECVWVGLERETLFPEVLLFEGTCLRHAHFNFCANAKRENGPCLYVHFLILCYPTFYTLRVVVAGNRFPFSNLWHLKRIW